MSARAWAMAALAVVSGGCEALVPAPAPARPTVTVLSPSTGFEVPFNTTFHVSAVARAPQGELGRLQVVLRGAVSTRRELLLSGAEQAIELDLAVPKDALLGPDRLELDLVLVVEATVAGRTVSGAAAGVSLVAVDRTAPTLDVASPDAIDAPEGFDFAFAAGVPFTLRLAASDPIGGVTALGVEAPAVLGGDRETRSPPARDATFDVVFTPPPHADLELRIFAEDAAQAANRATRTLRIRVGDGGNPGAPPQLTLGVPRTAECAAPFSVTATATDGGAGLERLALDAGSTRLGTRYAVSNEDRVQLTLTSTLGAPAPAGAEVYVSAWARDVYGQESPVRTATVVSVDTTAPALTRASGADLVPGQPWTAILAARESCGALAEAHLVVEDGAGTSTVVRAPLSGARIDGPVTFDVPENVCAAGPARAQILVFDDAGNPALSRLGALTVQDVLPPTITISVLQPGAGVRPGESLPIGADLVDLGRGVRSATVTVYAPDGARLAQTQATYPDLGCAGPRQQRLDLVAQVPDDIALVQAEELSIEVVAEDHRGQRATRRLTVPVLDDVPPQVRFFEPDPATPLLAGQTRDVSVVVGDAHHVVSQVELTVTGPALVEGQAVATRVVGARSATITFALDLVPLAPLGAPLHLVARVTDAIGLDAFAQLDMQACGAPSPARVVPDLGPVTGALPVTVYGGGFAPGASISLGGVPLSGVAVVSSSIAIGTVPAGPHSPGRVPATVSNLCDARAAPSAVQDAFRFVAPPTLDLVRPSASAGTSPGATLFVVAGARADGVSLVEIGAQAAGLTPARLSPTGASGTLDATLLAPTTATAAIPLLVWAEDALGQRTTVQRALPLDGASPQSLALFAARRTLAAGERAQVSVLARGADDAARDVTRTASVTTNAPAVLTVDGAGRLHALTVGTATLTAQLGSLQSSLRFEVVDDALWVSPHPLLLSPLAASASASAAPGRLEVLHLVGGRAVDVSAQASLTVTPASLAFAVGPQVYAQSPGAGEIIVSAAGREARRALTVSERLDVAVAVDVDVPADQRFLGGRILGAVYASRGAAGPWRLFVDPGGTLDLPGRLVGRGAPGGLSGGRGGAGAGAGGDVAGPGGDVSGGTAATALTSGGGGGGAHGAGGAGGHLVGLPAAVGGAGGVPDAVGGGGGGGGAGGGGGGARVVLDMAGAQLILDGEIDLSGGAGGTATSTSGAGGGGAGGRLLLRVQALDGTGRVRVAGGPGGDGAGGGGGGGAVTVEATGATSVVVDIDRAGGEAGAAAPSAVPGTAGAPGAALRP